MQADDDIDEVMKFSRPNTGRKWNGRDFKGPFYMRGMIFYFGDSDKKCPYPISAIESFLRVS